MTEIDAQGQKLNPTLVRRATASIQWPEEEQYPRGKVILSEKQWRMTGFTL